MAAPAHPLLTSPIAIGAAAWRLGFVLVPFALEQASRIARPARHLAAAHALERVSAAALGQLGELGTAVFRSADGLASGLVDLLSGGTPPSPHAFDAAWRAILLPWDATPRDARS